MTQRTPVAGQDYIVQPGDNLSQIAQEAYGDGSETFWRRIYEANRDKIGPDPNWIGAGIVISIPPLLKDRTVQGDSIMAGTKTLVNKSSSTLQITLERRAGEDPLAPSNSGVTVNLSPRQTQSVQYGDDQNPYLNAMRIRLEEAGACYEKYLRITQRGSGTLDNKMNGNSVFELDYQPDTNAFLFNAHN